MTIGKRRERSWKNVRRHLPVDDLSKQGQSD
jgi:hypothetical protein